MIAAENFPPIVRAHLDPPAGMVFHASLGSILGDFSLLAYWPVVERAWIELGLCGVLCLDGRPILYLRQQKFPSSTTERNRLQRLFWNQGVANVLVIADDTTVYIYSGLTKPQHDDPKQVLGEDPLVGQFTMQEYIQQAWSFHHALATGHYYEERKSKFDPKQSIDSYLLENLQALRDGLVTGEPHLAIEHVHAIIGRLLFVCYLLDRKIYSIGEPSNGGTGTTLLAQTISDMNPQEGIDFLYDLFRNLRERFNGNMFDQDLEAEKQYISASHLSNIAHFLNGDELKSGQQTLGFWVYDFKMIPVETISAIYQDFLSKEDEENQRTSGAVYTPRFLAEMVVDTAIDGNPEALNWTFLDPSCGSGIFLVILFNRVANYRLSTCNRDLDYLSKSQELKEILRQQIIGVDISETACRIACFSLYLAYLDFFEPSDIDNHIELTGKPLPTLLATNKISDRTINHIPVIHHGDFLAKDNTTIKKVNCVVGNPPWTGRQGKQSAQKFIEAAPEHLIEGGVGCVLLPTKILTNQTDSFQYKWLRSVRLEKVIQLADYRHLLFQGAKTPSFIARFINLPPHIKSHVVEYNAPKFHRAGLRRGVIYINHSSQTGVPLFDVLSATKNKTAPVVWKRHLWGTNRDQKFLDLLQLMPPLSRLAGPPGEGKRWIKGQGFQPYYLEKAEQKSDYPKAKPIPWKANHVFINSDKNLHIIATKTSFTTVKSRLSKIKASTEYLRKLPDKRLFKAPMVLINQGFNKIAYCDQDAVFQDSIQSISGPIEDAAYLKFLTVYLRSKLVLYFLFHTTANMASERDKVHLVELLRVPFPIPGDDFISPSAKNIIRKISRAVDQFKDTLESAKQQFDSGNINDYLLKQSNTGCRTDAKNWTYLRKKIADSFQDTMEPLIYEYFNLTEQEISLIEDTASVFYRSATPTTWNSRKTVTLDLVNQTAVQPYASKGLAIYADTLTSTLNSWAQVEGSDHRVKATGYSDARTGLTAVSIELTHHEIDYREISPSREFFGNFEQLLESIQHKTNTTVYERDILWFQNKRILIIRPNILLNWTRTAALNDAAKIYGDIALANSEQ